MSSFGARLTRRPLHVFSSTKAAASAQICKSYSVNRAYHICQSNIRRKTGAQADIRLGIRFNSHSASEYPPLGASNLPPARRSLPVRFVTTVGIAIFFGALGIYMASAPVITSMVKELGTTPTDEETLILGNPLPGDLAYEINEHITNHPLTKQLSANPKFTASRPHLKIPPTLRAGNFTGGTLVGADKMPMPPLVFATEDGTELVQIQYVGSALCGHPGIVHGGMLATLLDEGLARCCFPGLPNKVAVTASLKLDYRKPCMANQYVVLKAETEKFEGRKAWVKGRLETLPDDGSPGVVLVESEALFIEPRNAGVLAAQRRYVAGE